MKELHQYYTRRLLTLAVGVGLAAVLVPTQLVPWLDQSFGEDSFLSKTSSLLTSRISLVLILAAGEVVIRKWLWRKQNPELDFAGKWEGRTEYNSAYLGDNQVNLPERSEHGMRIEQNCLFFNLAPAEGKDYIHWGSLTAELIDKDNVVYAYWVNYTEKPGFPPRAKGIEEIKVTDRDSKGRPTRMTGNFYHCPIGHEPIFTGRVTFDREPS